MAVSKQPSITPETSSGEGLDEEPNSRAEAKWKRFHPFRVVRKIFRRRVKRQGTGEETSKKSWSTSELQSVQDTPHKYEVTSPPYKIGLSVSHDSIFSSESSNLVGSEDLTRPQGSSLSVQHAGIKNMFKDELFSRVRARRDSDEDEDIGLPHSPCTSPTTVDVLTQGLKSKSLKSGSLSAGSLISMGSSENDEDSAVASSSGNSSRMSLLDRRSLDFEVDPDFHQPVPLNHQAAHHKISVRPKRTHGLPQKRLKQKLAATRVSQLPTTPEVTEDNGKVYFQSESVESTTIAVGQEHLASIISAALLENTSHCTVESSTEFKEVHHVSSRTSFQVGPAVETSLQTNNKLDQLRDSVVSENPSTILNSPMTYNSQSQMNTYPEVTLNAGVGEAGETMWQLQNDIAENINDLACNNVRESSVKSVYHSTKLDFNVKVIKDEEKAKNLGEQGPLRVSALVKNIERSDSMSRPSKEPLSKGGSKQPAAKCDSNDSLGDTNLQEQNTEISFSNDMAAATNRNKTVFSADNILPEFQSKPSNTSSLTPSPNEQISLHRSFEERQLELEIRQQFQQQKAAKTQETSNILSRLYPEEESIMCEKSVSSGFPDKSLEKGDKHVIVSHQITEAHNLVTVDKSFSLNRQSFQVPPFQESVLKTATSEPWLKESDVSQNLSENNVSNVTINSSASNQKVMEDKVTVSINSICNEAKHISIMPEIRNSVPPLKSQPETSDNKLIGQGLSSQKSKSSKSENIKPPLKEKSPVGSKANESGKRLSVEIVPFNQRMKDRKYQPLIYPTNTPSGDSTKTIANSSVVERNLSDRRVNAKNKETGNNRHSFSGTLSTEIEKLTDKKPADKLHYPVQIRIHKNKTYEKENNCSKANREIKKSPSPEQITDAKPFSKTIGEIQAKWEVKVQSTTVTKPDAFISAPSDMDFNGSDSPHCNELEHDASLASRNNQEEELSPSNSFTESSLLKSRENTRKPSKEMGSSDDPEPELLRVFARRSIKQKCCDKDKSEDKKKETPIVLLNTELEHSAKEEKIPPKPRDLDLPELSGSSLKSPELVKKSKSFCEKEKHGPHVASTREVHLHRRPSLKAISPEILESDSFNRRQRIASEPDVLPTLPPQTDNTSSRTQQSSSSIENVSISCRSEHMQRGSVLSTSPSSTLSNGTSSTLAVDALKLKDNADVLGRDGAAPSWLQLAQQRRELREQRERMLIGSSTNSFLEASGKPSRSSKVWDMVNNFQKLQMT